ncbi:hypothetical protein MF406_08495 [Georgenia sp. TF02-10]|uniref:hypothetical protein n=1 Tax=Georgenia sp. TF02-10 TaxID=2917725 RepID=UPI001FA7E3B1|nr:hypothetical protein [Georgenia sp. TF02-10]UNX56216.1 hypothetical protein MF406_08495 [Georgenia sp. TF02-10]
MTQHDPEDIQKMASDAPEQDTDQVPDKPGTDVPNKETGVGLGAGAASSFEGEEDADTAADR